MHDFDPYLNDYEMFGVIDPEFNSIVPTLVGIYAVIFGIALLVGIAYYIMYGIALLRMAKRAGVKHGWLGFVPIADNWLLGRLSDVGSSRRHSGARLLGFSAATACSGICSLIALSSMFVRLIADENLHAAVSDEVAMQMVFSTSLPLLLFSLLAFVCAVCTAVFQCMALYRVGVNFGGASGSGFGIALILTIFFCPLATYIILLILSGRTPTCTDGIPSVSAPHDDGPTDSVFQ